MNHLFVPEKESLELKTLGFDEPCLGLYPLAPKELIYKILPNQFEAKEYFGGVLAPLYSQVFDWFRVKHGLFSYIEPVIVEHAASPIKFDYVILELNISEEIIFDTLPFHSNEKAQLACLQKLIEICKDDNTTRS